MRDDARAGGANVHDAREPTMQRKARETSKTIDGSCSAEHTLAVRAGGGRRVGRGELAVSCDPEALRRRDPLVIETMLHATMKDTDTHHREQLQIAIRVSIRVYIIVQKIHTLCAALEWSYTPPKNAVVASLPIMRAM